MATSFTFRGTHTGPFAGATGTIEPTGQYVEIDMETVDWFRGAETLTEQHQRGVIRSCRMVAATEGRGS